VPRGSGLWVLPMMTLVTLITGLLLSRRLE
jgi:hypothetical protein